MSSSALTNALKSRKPWRLLSAAAQTCRVDETEQGRCGRCSSTVAEAHVPAQALTGMQPRHHTVASRRWLLHAPWPECPEAGRCAQKTARRHRPPAGRRGLQAAGRLAHIPHLPAASTAAKQYSKRQQPGGVASWQRAGRQQPALLALWAFRPPERTAVGHLEPAPVQVLRCQLAVRACCGAGGWRPAAQWRGRWRAAAGLPANHRRQLHAHGRKEGLLARPAARRPGKRHGELDPAALSRCLVSAAAEGREEAAPAVGGAAAAAAGSVVEERLRGGIVALPSVHRGLNSISKRATAPASRGARPERPRWVGGACRDPWALLMTECTGAVTVVAPKGEGGVLLLPCKQLHARSCKLLRWRQPRGHWSPDCPNLQSRHPAGPALRPAAAQKANPAAGGLQAGPRACISCSQPPKSHTQRRPPLGGRPSPAAAGSGGGGMSAGGSFGGARGFQPRPPEKGVFPLDHFGECKSVRGGERGLLMIDTWMRAGVRFRRHHLRMAGAAALLAAGLHWGRAERLMPHTMEQGKCAICRLLCPLSLSLQIKEQYLECLKANGSESEACRELAKAYLKCRMDR